MNGELYTVKEVSKKLKCNFNLVYSLIKHGHLQALKLGSLKVTNFELNEFIRRNNGKDFSSLDNVTELKVELVS